MFISTFSSSFFLFLRFPFLRFRQPHTLNDDDEGLQWLRQSEEGECVIFFIDDG
jgi:hypothetical protein